MKSKLVVFLIPLLVSPSIFSGNTRYCPEGHSFIQIGMTEKEITDKCGQPTNKMVSNEPVNEIVPVTQLIYTHISQPNPAPGQVNAVSDNWYPGLENVYSQWSLPKATNDSFRLEVDIMKNKVSAIRMNGSGANEMSLCPGNPFHVGDDVSEVYTSCGSPETINTSYTHVPLPSQTKPVVWVYHIDEYQPNLRLTFVDGKLQSIE